MKHHISQFPDDLLKPQEEVKLLDSRLYSQIMFSGMGGSGFTGFVLNSWLRTKLSIPFIVIQDYSIPDFISEKTLFIAASYSGNTEETLSAVHQAKDKGATIVAVCSGGKLRDFCKENNYTCLLVEGGNPPRSALGLVLPKFLTLLHSFGFVDTGIFDELNIVANELIKSQDDIQLLAKSIAGECFEKSVVIYSEPILEAIAIRGRQQLNENSKILCWHHTIPEMNHNEIVGWAGAPENMCVLMLHHKNEFAKNTIRMQYCEDVFSQKNARTIHIHSKGDSFIQETIYLIHLLDWVSYYLGELNGVDITEVNVIEGLKNKLANS
jgi:glucose/mannose-6-phosphate isomerase